MEEKTLIIIPTYNERDNIPSLVQAIYSFLPTTHILVVDDNSPDGTGALVEEMRAQDERLHILHREGKMGLGTAYIAGFRWGLERGYDYLIEMDADFSHDPKYLPHLLAKARNGADLVIGSRYVTGGGTEDWGLLRKAISRGGSLYARSVLGIKVRDLTGGFKCFKRQTLEAIDLSTVKSNGYSFQIEMTYRVINAGLKVAEHPIVFPDRRVGQSKMSRKIFLEAFTMVWKLRLAK